MNASPRAPLSLAFLLTCACAPTLVPPSAFGADKDKAKSDLVSPEKRRATVEIAQRLTRPPEPVPVPADLPPPFNPPGFDQPDPAEVKAAQAAQAAAGIAQGNGGGGANPNQPARAPGDHEILENLAGKLPTKGSFVFNGEPLLVVADKRLKVGDKFTVTANGQDYELELIAIDRTTFTLRYHGEEIVRSIKNGK